MGLVYNNKNKLDIEILSEEKLEKNEGKLCDFVIIPESHDESTQQRQRKKRITLPPTSQKASPSEAFFVPLLTRSCARMGHRHKKN